MKASIGTAIRVKFIFECCEKSCISIPLWVLLLTIRQNYILGVCLVAGFSVSRRCCMTKERKRIGWGFWLQWALASTAGLYVGFIMAFVIAVFSELELGLGEWPGELAIGIVPGIGVGVLQWVVLRRRVSGAGWWVLASAAGGYGIIQAGFNGYSETLWSYVSLLGWTGVVALGGAVTGTLQWLVLREQVSRAGWWVFASTVGWGLGMTAAIAFSWGVGVSDFGALGGTGVVLGALTGGALVWMLRQPVPKS
jgi:hypothetical protein